MSKLDSVYAKLQVKTGAKMALIVLDGLGDLATRSQNWMTPLEAAKTPNLDALTIQEERGWGGSDIELAH